MPVKIKMLLSNGNYSKQILNPNLGNKSINIVHNPSSSMLNAPIIARIHNTKPGCGSCGKH